MVGAEQKQEKYELTISADGIKSTDERFTMDNINLGDNYKPLDAYFKKPMVMLSDVPIAKVREEPQIKHCQGSLFKYLRRRLRPCPLRKKKASPSVDIHLAATLSAVFSQVLKSSKSTETAILMSTLLTAMITADDLLFTAGIYFLHSYLFMNA